MRGTKLLIACFVMLVATAVPNVNAALIATDWQAPGDSLLTLDSDTGLEWLDWSHTNNRSFSDVSSQLGLGGEFDGFRYATLAEIETLYTNVGFVFPSGSNAANVPFAQNFTTLFGVTFGGGPPNSGGVEAWFDHSTSPGTHWVTAINHGNGLVQPLWFDAADGNVISFAGSALVRQTQPIPEPTSLAIFGIGALGMVVRRRKRRKD